MPGTKVGFIGLGRMGLPMAYRLLSAGFDLTVHNRSQGKVQEIATAGAKAATSVAEVVLGRAPAEGGRPGVRWHPVGRRQRPGGIDPEE